MKKTLLLATAAVLAFNVPAFAADKEVIKTETKVEKDSKGNVDAKSSATHTDAAGTTTTSEKKVDVDVDSKGNADSTVKTKETVDPKGLFNKTTTKTTDKEKVNADGSVDATHKKTVDGKTVESETTKH